MSRYRNNDFDDRDHYAPRPVLEVDEVERRRPITRSPPRIRPRDLAFLHDDRRGGAPDAGQLVLRQRDVETYDRRMPSPPSPGPPPPNVRVVEERFVRRGRSVSPPSREHDHVRIVERERSVERRSSPSPVRMVRRRRSSSSSVGERERIHARIVEKERGRPRAPSPQPIPEPPPVVRGPTLEREVITHYTDIDHGVIKARQPSPSPQPPPRRHHHHVQPHQHTRETDIDIDISKGRTNIDVDIQRSTSRGRHHHDHHHKHHDELIIDDERLRDRFRRRAHSAAPPLRDDEEIAPRIDARGKMGEAQGGATRDWTIVDVPPGTERVRMDGAGGGATDTTWTKYSGVRRTKFIPEKGADATALVPIRKASPPDLGRREQKLSVSIYDKDREIDVVADRRVAKAPPPPPAAPPREMWTEITKDLVSREAIEKMGYHYEETKWFYYIMEYLRYDDVLQLTEMSARIRRARKERAWERQLREEMEWRRHHPHHGHHHNHHHHHGYDVGHRHRASVEWDREREIVIDDRRVRGYLH